MKTLITILALCTMTAHARIMPGGYWPAPRVTTAPAGNWWEATNQYTFLFREWRTNSTTTIYDDSGKYNGSGTMQAAKLFVVDLGGGQKVMRHQTRHFTIGSPTGMLTGVTKMTLGGWVNLVVAYNGAPTLSSRAGGGAGSVTSLRFGLDGVTMSARFATNSASQATVTAGGSFATGKWVSVVATYDAGKTILYTNSVMVGSNVTASLPLYSSAPFLSGYDDGGANALDGFVDWQFGITGTVWSASQVSQWHGGTYPTNTVP